MHDVPWVLDRYAILRLEAYCARPGELVETFPGEDSPEDKVACLESAWAYMAAVVAS